MGYTKSIRAIKLVQLYLDAMLASQTNIEFEAEDAATLAYQIRSGIKVAQARLQDPNASDEYKKYSGLQAKFIIRLKDNKVVAELRDPTPIPIKKALSKLVVHDVNDSLEAIGALIEHKSAEVLFPNYDDDKGLHVLHNYTEANGYKIIKHDVGITITKNEIDESVTWKP